MRHFDRDQAAAYLAAAPPAYRPLAELLISTGLRIGEAVALEWADVDTEALTIRVSRSRKVGGKLGGTKTDQARIIQSARAQRRCSSSTAARPTR
jgi:integrase